MPGFKVSVDHQLGKEVAVQRLKSFADVVRTEMAGQVSNVQESWDEQGFFHFAFSAMGMSIEGKMETTEIAVRVEGKIPFAAVPFKGMIEKTIAEKINHALASQ